MRERKIIWGERLVGTTAVPCDQLLLEVLLDIRDQLDGLYALIVEVRPGVQEITK